MENKKLLEKYLTKLSIQKKDITSSKCEAMVCSIGKKYEAKNPMAKATFEKTGK